MVEFHVHGSRSVVEAIHNSISKVENCRLAEPGEFTKIAFQNGKVNLLKLCFPYVYIVFWRSKPSNIAKHISPKSMQKRDWKNDATMKQQ